MAALAARLAGSGGSTPMPRWPGTGRSSGAAGKDAVTVRQLHQPPGRAAGGPAAAARRRRCWTGGDDRAPSPRRSPGGSRAPRMAITSTRSASRSARCCGGRRAARVGTLLREELAGPLGADVHIGLPARRARPGRRVPLAWRDAADEARPEPDDDRLMECNAYSTRAACPARASSTLRAGGPRSAVDQRARQRASGIARVYAALAAGGAIDGVRVVEPRALAEATTEQVYGQDRILHRPCRFGLGFQLTQPERPMGRGAGAFGHFGAGGSLGFCDPQAGSRSAMSPARWARAGRTRATAP